MRACRAVAAAVNANATANATAAEQTSRLCARQALAIESRAQRRTSSVFQRPDPEAFGNAHADREAEAEGGTRYESDGVEVEGDGEDAYLMNGDTAIGECGTQVSEGRRSSVVLAAPARVRHVLTHTRARTRTRARARTHTRTHTRTARVGQSETDLALGEKKINENHDPHRHRHAITQSHGRHRESGKIRSGSLCRRTELSGQMSGQMSGRRRTIFTDRNVAQKLITSQHF